MRRTPEAGVSRGAGAPRVGAVGGRGVFFFLSCRSGGEVAAAAESGGRGASVCSRALRAALPPEVPDFLVAGAASSPTRRPPSLFLSWHFVSSLRV